jgi:hypothetical protein
MRNNIKHALVALVAAAILLAFSSCGEDDFFSEGGDPTIITITGFLSANDGKYVTAAIGNPNQDPKSKNKDLGFTIMSTQISNDRVTLDFYYQDSKGRYKDASVDNKLAMVLLFISADKTKNFDGEVAEVYILKTLKTGSNSFDYNDFTDIPKN